MDAISHKSRSVLELGKKFLYEQLEMDIKTAYRFVHPDCTAHYYTSNITPLIEIHVKICYDNYAIYYNNSGLL